MIDYYGITFDHLVPTDPADYAGKGACSAEMLSEKEGEHGSDEGQ
jgi:hypothetical protein